jgi:hypothetical protein
MDHIVIQAHDAARATTGSRTMRKLTQHDFRAIAGTIARRAEFEGRGASCRNRSSSLLRRDWAVIGRSGANRRTRATRGPHHPRRIDVHANPFA